MKAQSDSKATSIIPICMYTMAEGYPLPKPSYLTRIAPDSGIPSDHYDFGASGPDGLWQSGLKSTTEKRPIVVEGGRVACVGVPPASSWHVYSGLILRSKDKHTDRFLVVGEDAESILITDVMLWGKARKMHDIEIKRNAKRITLGKIRKADGSRARVLVRKGAEMPILLPDCDVKVTRLWW